MPENAPSQTVSLPHYVFSPKLLELLPRVEASPRGEYEIQDAIQGLIDAGGRVVGVRAGEGVEAVVAGGGVYEWGQRGGEDEGVSATVGVGGASSVASAGGWVAAAGLVPSGAAVTSSDSRLASTIVASASIVCVAAVLVPPGKPQANAVDNKITRGRNIRNELFCFMVYLSFRTNPVSLSISITK